MLPCQACSRFGAWGSGASDGNSNNEELYLMGNLRDSMSGERSQLAKPQRHDPPERPLLAKRRSVRCDKRHHVYEQRGDGGWGYP